MNPYTTDYVKSHQDALRRDAADHRPVRQRSLGDGRRRGSPASSPRLALARLLMILGAKLAPTDAGFVAASRVVVLPEPRCDERGIAAAA